MIVKWKGNGIKIINQILPSRFTQLISYVYLQYQKILKWKEEGLLQSFKTTVGFWNSELPVIFTTVASYDHF